MSSVNDYSGLGPGQDNKVVTTHGTPVQLSTTSPPCREVSVTAFPGNTGNIAVGFSDSVRATPAGGEKGLAILAAGHSVSIPIQNAGFLWIDASVDGEGAAFAWE